MSGNNRFLLDTNFLIYALSNPVKLPQIGLCFSVISKIELLAYSGLTEFENQKIRTVLSLLKEVMIDDVIVEKTIVIRKQGNLKLPDSLILASALQMDAVLVTNDKKLLACEGSISIDVDAFLHEHCHHD